MGTAKDAHGPFFLGHAAADFGDGLIYREAYTPYAAAEVVDRLKACGLRSASLPSRVARGDTVFVYRAKEAVSTQLSAASHSAR